MGRASVLIQPRRRFKSCTMSKLFEIQLVVNQLAEVAAFGMQIM